MKEYTIPGWRANLYGLLFAVPAVLLSVTPYLLIWCEHGTGFRNGLHSIIDQNRAIIQGAAEAKWWALVLLLAGIATHELIHGVLMAAFARNGWKSVFFGFNIKAFAPYAHCREPLPPGAYRISAAMPGILLGDIPVLAGWFSGNILFLCFGILFQWAAAGDLTVLWLSRHIDNGVLQDHPDKIGFVHISDETAPAGQVPKNCLR